MRTQGRDLAMIQQWLTDRTTLEKAGRRYRLACSPRWREFQTEYRDGDEVWYFRSPDNTWPARLGAAGVAIVRGGRVVAHYVAMRT
jgi:hypothetical protein